MINRNIAVAGLLAGLCLFAAPGAQAGYIDQFYSKVFTETDWNDVWIIDQFDTLGGMRWLTSIEFELFGEIESDIQFENLSTTSGRSVDWSVLATLTLKRPDSTILVVTVPTVTGSDSLTAYDGVTDFGGTSGRSYMDQTASKTETFISPPPASDLSLFTGTGTLSLPISAVADSGGFSGGNWLFLIGTDARAEGRIRYNFEQVPEPGTVALMALGLVGLAGVVYRRRKREEQA